MVIGPPMAARRTAGTWAQAAITAAAWIALPALAGGWRVLHRPVDA